MKKNCIEKSMVIFKGDKWGRWSLEDHGRIVYTCDSPLDYINILELQGPQHLPHWIYLQTLKLEECIYIFINKEE